MMVTGEQLRERIVQEIEKLPEDQLGDVLAFVDSLAAQRMRIGMNSGSGHRPDPAADPLVAFIGSAEHGSLAHNIDDALYGS